MMKIGTINFQNEKSSKAPSQGARKTAQILRLNQVLIKNESAHDKVNDSITSDFCLTNHTTDVEWHYGTDLITADMKNDPCLHW